MCFAGLDVESAKFYLLVIYSFPILESLTLELKQPD